MSLLVAMSAQAQETNAAAAPATAPTPGSASPWNFNFGKQPRPQNARTVIDAQDGAWFDDTSNTIEFFGKVVVHDPQFTLTCDRLNVVLNKNRQGPQLVTATGNVNIEQQGTNDAGEKVISSGKAGVAIYEPATGDITLKVWPQVRQGKNFQVATEEGTIMVLNNKGSFHTKGQTRTMILDAGQTKEN
jgi:lipopolysaccharide transport protein LptA